MDDWDVSDEEIATAVGEFRHLEPRAKLEQAEAEADRVFTERPDQMRFLRLWQKYEDHAQASREAKFKSEVNRRWSGKGYD